MFSRRVIVPEGPLLDLLRPLAAQAGYELDAFTRLVGLSRRSLERICQRELGLAPGEWLQTERMTCASRLLAVGQPAKLVALHLGYTQLGNFSRDFKRHFGRCPTSFAPRPRLPFLRPAAPAV